MLYVEVNNDIKVFYAIGKLIDYINEHLWVSNPDYLNRVKLKKWLGGVPQRLYLYKREADNFILPYGFKDRLKAFLDKNDIKYQWKQENDDVPIKMVEKEPLNLYDYQRKAVDDVLKHDNGILISPAGSGKTRMAMEIIGKRNQKTLWLTNNLELLRQSKKTFKAFFSNKVGEISGGKVDIQDITFATVQTFSKVNLNLYKDMFGMIIVDETHRVVGSPTRAMQFYKVISNLNAKYKYGLTATLFDKKNDMSIVPIFTLGEKLYEVDRKDINLITAKHVKYDLYTKPSEVYLNPDKTIDFTKLITYITSDIDRNAEILVNLVECKDRHNLILTSRNHQLEILSFMLDSFGIKNHVLIGETKQKDREVMLDDFKNGRVNFILSNYQLAKEGLDLPIADTLHLAAPMREKKTIIQSAGRVERVYEGKKESIVYDYVDVLLPMTKRMYNERRRHLNGRL